MATRFGAVHVSCGRVARLMLSALLLAGCQLAPVNGTASDKNLTSALPGSGDRLINEGVPVFFTLSGVVAVPAYYKGNLTSLVVAAAQLKGGAFAGVSPVQVAADGSFALQVPPTSKLFFLTTSFTQDAHTYHLRALVRAQPDTPVILDATSSLMGAPIAAAASGRSQDELSFSETSELTSDVRADDGVALNIVDLSQSDTAQASALNQVVSTGSALSARLLKWETALAASPILAPVPNPSPTPGPISSATAPPPSLGK
jgi:hypothetical protein